MQILVEKLMKVSINQLGLDTFLFFFHVSIKGLHLHSLFFGKLRCLDHHSSIQARSACVSLNS